MVSLYIIQQLMCVIILFRLKTIYSILSLSLTFIIFNFKPDTYDIISYTKSVGNPQGFETLFRYLILTFSLITNDSRLVVTYYQLLILCLSASIILLFRNNRILILATIFSSVAVILATHNNLRQGTSSLLILIGILLFLRGNIFLFLLPMFLSYGFHLSSVFFISCCLITYLLYVFFLSKSQKKSDLNMHLIYISSFVIGLAFAFTFYLLSKLEIIIYLNYVGLNLTIDNERTPLDTKVIALIVLSFTTELFLRFSKVNYQVDYIRFLKLAFLFFIFFISLNKDFDEIGARISYFYYVIEMGLLCYLLDKKIYLPSVIIIFFYAFAFNVWNILGGL